MAEEPPWPAEAVAALACPRCLAGMSVDPAGLRCARGHAFDQARQGYVHLASAPIRHPGDTAVMVQARERVQSAGLFDELTQALVAAVPDGAGVIVDLGAGTGHHLAAVLRAADRPPATPTRRSLDPARRRSGSTGGARPVGIAVDSSKPALRRAARAHARLLAIAADVTGALPLQDGAADVAMVAFAPRSAGELVRILKPGGALVVAAPTPDHLVQIRDPLGMLAVPPGKGEQLAEALGPAFTAPDQRTVHHDVVVDRHIAVDLALMGPAGFHADMATLAVRAESLAARTKVTIAVVVHILKRC